MCLYNRAKRPNVFILDVPTVSAQVDSYSARARDVCKHRGRDNAGLERPPRLPYRGDVIDVYIQSDSAPPPPDLLARNIIISATARTG